MSVRDLEHLLWRYEYGRLSEARLDLEFRDGLRRLLDARAVQGDPAAADRWDAAALLAMRREAIRRTAKAIDTRRWRDAMREIRRGDEALAAVDALVAAARKVESAIAAAAAVRQLALTEFLCALPAIAALTETVEAVRRCMQAHEYRVAEYLAGPCLRLAEPLLERRRIAAVDYQQAEQRLAAIAEIYDATQVVAIDAEPDPTRDGSLDHLRYLFGLDRTALATRLLTEIEIALLGRRRFRLHFRDRLRAADVTALARLVAQHSWHGAVDSDWHGALARQSAVLNGYAARAASAAANLDAAFH